MPTERVVHQNAAHLANGVDVHRVRQHEPVVRVDELELGEQQMQEAGRGRVDLPEVGLRFPPSPRNAAAAAP
jgi:hypothetical protein